MPIHTIASMIMSYANLKSYSDTCYHNDELKSLTHYHFDKVKEWTKLKSSVSRLVCILFLDEFPKGSYCKNNAICFYDIARNSIGSPIPAKSLKHTIRLIQKLTSKIDIIKSQVKAIMTEINSLILSIQGISYNMEAMIIAEVGNFSRFVSTDNILAYTRMSPSTYQLGQLLNGYSHMERRGSRYLRYALYNAAKYVCHWDESSEAYLAKKRTEGKHYIIALFYTTKKLVRTIYVMEKSSQADRIAT